MSFGHGSGYGRTPTWAGALGGILQGLLGYQKARQDQQQQGQQDKLDALRQALLQHQMQQGDQQFQANQAAAAHERQRQDTQDVQDQRAPTLAILSHLLSQNPEHAGTVADAYQSYQSTGHLPAQVPLHAAIPLMLPFPGAPGNVPATVNVPGSLGNIYSAAGLPQSERDFQARQRQASDLAGEQLTFKRENQAYLQQRDALREQAKLAAGRFKDRNAFYQKTHENFVKGGMKLEDLGPAMQEALDNWDAVNGGAASTGGGAISGNPDPDANPRGTPVLAPAALGGPAGTLPGVQAGIAAKNAQAARANAQTAVIPRRQADQERRTQILQDRQDSYDRSVEARNGYLAAQADFQAGRLNLDQLKFEQQKARDNTNRWLGTERNRIAALRATLSHSQRSPETDALKLQINGLERTRASLQSQYNKAGGAQTANAAVNPGEAARFDQKAKDLFGQIQGIDGQINAALGRLRSMPARGSSGLPVLPEVGAGAATAPPVGSRGSIFSGPPASLAGSGPKTRAAGGSERQRFIQRALRNGASRREAEQKANEFELR